MRSLHADFRLSTILLLLVLLGQSIEALAGRASGQILYVDKVYDFNAQGAGYVGTQLRAARFVAVELRRADGGTVIGSGPTDAEGRYSFPVASVGTMELELYVIASSSNSPWTNVEVRDNDWSQRLQTVAVGPFTRNTNGDFSFSYTVPTDDGRKRLGGMFNIIDSILTGAQLVYSQTGQRVPTCVVYWEDGSSDGTYYPIGSNALYLLGGTPGDLSSGDDDSYDDPVILHEYGHFLANRFSLDRSPGGEHSLTGYYTPTLSWSEGWASALQCFARNSALYWDARVGDRGGFNVDYERAERNLLPLPQLRGMNNEGAVTCVLYDLFDDADSHDRSEGVDDDAYGYGFAPIWRVFTLDFGPAVMATLDDFYEGWTRRFANLPVDEAFANFAIEFVPLSAQEAVFSRTTLGLNIPDNRTPGITDTITVPGTGKGSFLTPSGVRVWVAIEHRSRGDLAIRLIHPDGTAIPLKASNNFAFGSDVLEWYGYDSYEKPNGSLSALTGKSAAGLWKLEVSDERRFNTGVLRSWRLKLSSQGSSFWTAY